MKYIIGIDVSKDFFYSTIINTECQTVKEFSYTFSLKGLKTFLYTLQNPFKIAQIPAEEIAEFLKKVSRGKIKTAKAQRIAHQAKNTFAILEMSETASMELIETLKQAYEITKRIKVIEKRIKKSNHPLIFFLAQFKGIGLVSASTIVAEIGDKNFRHPDAIVAFSGLDIVVKQSGKRKAEYHISKRGNEYLRCALWFLAFSLIRWNEIFRDYFKWKIEEGKTVKQAIIACAKKSCRFLFKLIKEYKNTYISP